MGNGKSGATSVLTIMLAVAGGGCLLATATIGGCFVLAGKAAYEVQKQGEARVRRLEAQPISDVTWQEIDRIYNLKSSFTELQKDAHWKRYHGEKVRWSGTVSHLSETLGTVSLQIKLNPGTFTSDVLVRLKESERQRALSLQQGSPVTFVGILDDWGSLMPVTLNHGEIVGP